MSTDISLEFRRRAEKALEGRLDKIVLFGSRARGDEMPDSDWDFAVFLKGRLVEGDRFKLSGVAYDLLLETGQFIQPVLLSGERESEDSLLMRNIRSEGRLV